MALGLGGPLTTALGTAYTAIVVGFSVLWIGLNAYQYYPVVRAVFGRPFRGITAESATANSVRPDGGTLPRIDLLLPAYEEAEVIEQAIHSVRAADYPDDHLDLTVLIEPDDESTRRVLEYLSDTYTFETYEIPPEYPGSPSKPRALNYGFTRTDGDIVGVIDAEDIVTPGLFNEVAVTFRETGCEYALGHLDMANEDDGWLNLLFRAEYGFWYDIVVPAFTRVGYPVPLGGTTCFFRRETLDAIAESRIDREGSPWALRDWLWLHERDWLGPVPWNQKTVTEDFELGLRLWEEGHRFAYLESVTAEESPVSLDGWLDQRIRWQTGKLQTYKRYLQRPPDGLRRRAHVTWQSFLPHLGPVNLLGAVLVFWLSFVLGVIPSGLTGDLLTIGLAFLVGSAGMFAIGYWSVSNRPPLVRFRRSLVVLLTIGFYWLLQWLADLHALANLHRGRIKWKPSKHFGRHIGVPSVAAGAYVDRPELGRELERSHVLGGLGLVLALGAGLRLFHLDRWSLWHDEIYTMTVRASAPIPELVTMTGDPHPPLYYLVAHGWMEWIGTTPTAMRELSVLFSLGTVVAVFLLARSVYDVRTGLIASLLVAVSVTHVHFGRTVRMYSLFTLLSVLSWYGYVELRRDGCCFDWLAGRELVRAVAYVLVTTALVYTHVYGLFVVISQHLTQFFLEDGRVDRRIWWTAQTVIGLLSLPWLIVIARQLLTFNAGTSPIDWIPPPSIGQLRETLLVVGGYPSFYPIDAESALALAIVSIILSGMTIAVILSILTVTSDGSYHLLDGRQAAMLGLFSVGLLVPFVLSFLVVPMFVPRYTIVASIPVFILVGRGVQRAPGLHLRGLLIAVLIIGSLGTTTLYYQSDTVADWRGVSSYLAEESREGDLVIYQPTWIQEDVEFYAPRLPTESTAIPPDDRLSPGDIERVQALASNHGTVYLVLHRDSETSRILNALRDSHRGSEVASGGVIIVYRFERTAATNGTPSTAPLEPRIPSEAELMPRLVNP